MTAKRKPAKAAAVRNGKARLTRGSPVPYSEELANRILRRLANGESLRSICQDSDMPDRGTVLGWVKDLHHFEQPYARAREMQLDAFAMETIDIADNEPDPAKARVRVAARQWLAERLAPKKYGTRVEHSGAVDGNIHVTFLAEDEKIL